ncbi:MAG: Peptidoglycan-associated lipoprotein [Holosporales bacterium]
MYNLLIEDQKMKKIVMAAVAAIALTSCDSDQDVSVNSTAPGSAGDFKKVGDRVHFGFDKACIAPEAKETLAKQAAWLKTYQERKVQVVGKCDERGTREYNLGLGEKRAANVAAVLKEQGVDAGRISVVSYGKDRPEVPNATTEEQHQQNRVAISEIAG